LKVADPCAPVASVAVTVTEVPPSVVGVPLKVHVEVLKVSPAGVPVALHVIGPGVTTAVSLVAITSGVIAPAERLVVWLPGLVTVTVFGEVTVNVKMTVFVAVVLSVAVTCTENGLPVCVVGVPLITPVAVLMVSPGGRAVADHVNVVMPGSESVADIAWL
jgi:stage V sporulation protein SpoVS